jgi:hypothetical protein
MRTVALGLVTTILLTARAPAADVIHLDLSGIDRMTFLSEEDRELLRELILIDVQGNFDAALGEGEVVVTTDPNVPADRTAHVHNSWGRHRRPHGSTGPHYGKWDATSAEVDVYLKNFYRADRWAYWNSMYGEWDLLALANGIGRVIAHELTHSYSVGHNRNTGGKNRLPQNKMTEKVSRRDRAEKIWNSDEHSANVIRENLGKNPCETAEDYRVPALRPVFYDAPAFPDPDYDPNQPISDPNDPNNNNPLLPLEEYGCFDALLQISGPSAEEFDLGWYGVDSDDGMEDGNPDFDFVYKASAAEPNVPEVLTFFEVAHGGTQFVLRGREGSGYDGEWFPMSELGILLDDPVVTPDGEEIFRLVHIVWHIDDDLQPDVIVTLNNFMVYDPWGAEFNGWQLSQVWSCLGDLDHDYDIDLADLAALLANYGQTHGATFEDGDLDGDRDVDLADLALLLSVYGTSCPGPGDDCDNAISLTLSLVDLPYTDVNATCGRGDDYRDSCLGYYDDGEDIIYELNVAEFMAVGIFLDPLGTPWTGIAIDDTCPPGDPCLALSWNHSSQPHGLDYVFLDPGTYYVMIDTWPEPQCIPEFTLTILDITPPENDFCECATPVGEVVNLPFETRYASFDGPGLCMTGDNIWYCYTPSCTGPATVSLCGSTFDTMLAVYDGCSCYPVGPMIDCNDDYCGLQSQITFDAIAGHEYLIEVGGSGDAVGAGVLTIECVSTQCVPPGQDCWATTCGQSHCGFSTGPIPADFFEAGPEPFDGVIELGSASLTDAVGERLGGMCLSEPLPSTAEVPVEVMQVDLIRCEPITVMTGG